MIKLKQKREMNEFALQGFSSSSSSPSTELLVSVPPNVRKLRIANEKKNNHDSYKSTLHVNVKVKGRKRNLLFYLICPSISFIRSD